MNGSLALKIIFFASQEFVKLYCSQTAVVCTGDLVLLHEAVDPQEADQCPKSKPALLLVLVQDHTSGTKSSNLKPHWSHTFCQTYCTRRITVSLQCSYMLINQHRSSQFISVTTNAIHQERRKLAGQVR